MYFAYVTKLKNVRKHPDADRLQLADCFGNTVCVSLDYYEGQLGVYFPTDGQLSVEFAEANNLLRKKDAEGNNIGGYMDPEKRNVTAIKLRGEKSDGLFLPLTCLESFGDISNLNEGDTINVFNGHEICTKYIPRGNGNRRHGAGKGNGAGNKKPKHAIAINFKEHEDTEQLAYNLKEFKAGDEIEITLKMHGTSQRTAYLPTFAGYNDSNVRKFINRIIMATKVKGNWGPAGRNTLFHNLKHGEPKYAYGYITGTRRVVLDNFDDGGFYGSNEFRKQHHDKLVNKLRKGETVYYEVVGFTHDGKPIMGTGKNDKLGKDFVKQYGKETVFSYGCASTGKTTLHGEDNDGKFSIDFDVPQSDMYVYRMTMTNDDGDVVEYTPDFMRYRCEQMGVKTVPVFGKGILSSDRFHFTTLDGVDHDYLLQTGETLGDLVMRCAEEFVGGADPVGRTHTREGVVVRIINRPKFKALKYKNFEFKVLEGLVKDTATAPDMEEAQEVTEVECIEA